MALILGFLVRIDYDLKNVIFQTKDENLLRNAYFQSASTVPNTLFEVTIS